MLTPYLWICDCFRKADTSWPLAVTWSWRFISVINWQRGNGGRLQFMPVGGGKRVFCPIVVARWVALAGPTPRPSPLLWAAPKQSRAITLFIPMGNRILVDMRY